MAYHHGNLRDALVQAGVDILAEQGLDALTLRGCAARAGVSHAAPKNHFDNLEGLRAAIIAEGFRRHRAAMRARMADAAADPWAQLLAAARGYVDFALNSPDLFRLMFSTARWNAGTEELNAAADGSYAVLREICAPLVLDPDGTGAPASVVETMVWSSIHGYASLLVTTGFRRAESAIGRVPDISEVMPRLWLSGTTGASEGHATDRRRPE
jgi:AcrR family transcriptional regulator